MNGLLAGFDISRGLVALAIAIALFAVVRNETNLAVTNTFEVPVDLQDVPPGLLAAPADVPPSVRVRLSASRDALEGIQSSSLRASVDLRRGTSGLEEYPVLVELPDPRIRLVEVVPPRLPVRLEESIERSVPVRVNRTGNVPFGYETGAIDLEPPEVAIAGPASVVRRVAAVAVDLKLDGVTVDVEANYRVVLLDAQGQPETGRQLRVTPESVRLRLPISQQVSYKSVAVRANVGGNVQTGYTIEGINVDPPVVTVVGPPRVLGGVDFASTERIEVGDSTGTFARQVSVLVPEGVFVLQQDFVRVTVRLSPLLVAQPITTAVVVEGVAQGLRLSGPVPTVQVVIQGPPTIVRALNFGEIRATANVAALGPGLHQVPVAAAVPSDLTFVGVSPDTVSITIERVLAPPEPVATISAGQGSPAEDSTTEEALVVEEAL